MPHKLHDHPCPRVGALLKQGCQLCSPSPSVLRFVICGRGSLCLYAPLQAGVSGVIRRLNGRLWGASAPCPAHCGCSLAVSCRRDFTDQWRFLLLQWDVGVRPPHSARSVDQAPLPV